MAYIANTDLQTRVGAAAYVQFADDDGDNIADTAVVDEIRLAAEAEINSYLAARYQVPVDLGAHGDLSDMLKSVTLDVAEYRLRLRRPPIADDARRKYEQTVAWLSRIATGVIALPAAANVSANTARGTVATTTGDRRVLSRDELSNY